MSKTAEGALTLAFSGLVDPNVDQDEVSQREEMGERQIALRNECAIMLHQDYEKDLRAMSEWQQESKKIVAGLMVTLSAVDEELKRRVKDTDDDLMRFARTTLTLELALVGLGIDDLERHMP